MKYFIAVVIILALLLCLQRGCKGFGERWHERMEEFKERREQRIDDRKEQFENWQRERKHFFRRRRDEASE